MDVFHFFNAKSFLTLAVVGGIFFSGCQTAPEKVNSSTAEIQISQAEYATIDTLNHFEINLVYPVIEGQLSEEVLNEINNSIAEQFYAFSDQNTFIESHKNLPEDFDSAEQDWLGVLQNSYRVYQCDSMVSVWFSIYQYYLGSAHGFTINHTLHYDLKTGKEISFSDFFDLAPSSLEQLKNLINTHLPDSVCWGVENDSSAIENLQNFILTTDSVSLKVDQYELCPYAFGVGEITFSKSDFHGILKAGETLNCREIFAPQEESEIATH